VKWTNDGIAIGTAPTENFAPTIISDGSAGAIITWYTNLFVTPTDGNDIYAQRINASGVVQWVANGVAICKATADQSQPVIISDGSAGAIISWGDQRSGTYDVYAQRISANGTLQWTTDGAAICTATNSQSFPTIASDGGAGAIITWYDFRSGANYDIYAQRINASGGVQWTTDGIAVSTAGGDQTFGNGSTSIISNSNAESIITWRDARNGSGYDIYAQHVNANGSITIGSQTITAFTPASGPIGTTVTITGTNFSATPADNTVRFNGTLANVIASSTTSITTTVPSGASTGTITVTVAGNTATSGSNFTVTTPSIIITTQPSDHTACDGDTAMFTTIASGTTNITYQWQFAPASAGPYTDIANGGGYSNVTASTLSVNTAGNFGAGHYRCKVSGDLATDEFSNTVTLTLNSLPATPTIASEAGCAPVSITINASGGANGEYRWYTASAGGTPIAGEVNSSYTTPVMNSSDDYYVSIDNGICESARNGVTAQVNTPPLPPTAVSTTACAPSSVTLTAFGAGENKYHWYIDATGGTLIPGELNETYVTPSLSTATTYYVTIKDSYCESARTAVLADIKICTANLPPSIIPASTTTQIDEKVTLDLAVLISDPDNNLDLSTLKIIIQPESKAIAFIDSEHNLTIDYKGNSFTGKDHLTIEVCDLAGSCAQQEITIDVEGDIIVYNAISPNGDSKNDTWMIKNIELLQDTRFNHVTIFNRWGDAVFETDNYDNLSRQFNGRNKNGSELPAGTYFYKITFASGRKLLTGYISLKR
jgi:gliding motility-associated-like protein